MVETSEADTIIKIILLELENEDERKNFNAIFKHCQQVDEITFVEEWYKLTSIDERRNLSRHYMKVEEGQFNIGNKLKLHPKAYLQMHEKQRRKLVELFTRRLNDEIDEDKLSDEVQTICTHNHLISERQRIKQRQEVSQALEVKDIEEAVIGGRKIFENIKPYEVQRVHNVFTQSCIKYNNDFINFGRAFADRMKCENSTEFCAATEYAARRLKEDVSKRLADMGTYTNEDKKECYHEVCLELMTHENEKFKLICDGFIDLKNRCQEYQTTVQHNRWFANLMVAANHYDKHTKFPEIQDSDMTLRQYFNLADTLTSEKMAVTSIVRTSTQDGSSLQCKFTCPLAIAYTFSKPDGRSVIATLYPPKKKVHKTKSHYVSFRNLYI